MAMNLDALLRIKASVSGEREIQRLGNSMQGVTGKVKNLQMAFAALGGTIVVADAARRYFQGFNEAEKAAAAVRTLGVDSKTLSAQLLNVSNRLGGLYSQTQLLAASYDVASAGFANAADNAKILEAAAKGATGGLSDINTVGNAVTSVLNAYGKSADQAAALVDGFIQTQNDGKIVLDEYAQQIGRLAPSAAASGVGINELNAAIATITAQGVPVEATFAGLNQALVAILKPSKEASDLAAELGIQFNETGLRTKGFGGLLDEVKQKTGGSTTALVQLFGGVDALKAILPLVNDDLVKYNKNLANQANASGVAEDATRELGGTVSSEISKMINQIGNLTRSLDTVLGPALGGIVRLINFVIAEATRGIQVLGQLFSMSPNATLAKQAVAAGQLGNVGRVLPGIDELIGEERRKELQRKAGAGTGLFGLGMNQSKFIELLQKESAFKQSAQPQITKPTANIDPRIQAILDGLGEGGSKKSGKKGKSEAEKAAEKAAKEAERIAEQTAQQLKSAQDLQFTQANQLLQLRAKNDFERAFVEFGIKRSEIERKYNELLQQSKSAEETKLLQQARAAEYKQSSITLEQRSIELTKQAAQPLNDILKSLQDQAAYQREYGELIKNGTNPELAKQIIEINRAYEASVAALEPALAAAQAAVTKAQAEGASATEIEKYRKELERIQEIRGGLEGTRGKAITTATESAAKPQTLTGNLGEKIKELKDQLDPIKVQTDLIVNGATSIGSAFGQAFQDIATGAKSTQQALADTFKAIGESFISMAAEIIAKQMTLILLQTIFNALSGGGNKSAVVPSKVVPVSQMPAGMAFAEGGYVTGPTQAVVGEGGQPEYIIPASKMRSAMQRYAGGARGDAVIPGNGSEPTAAGGEAIATGAIDVRYTVERINSIDYVTADQFQAGLRQAATQGAKQGEQATLRRLQQSTATRRKLGM